MTKTAIILFNLGGPDDADAVKPFLFNLFNDPAIIRLPNPLRYLLAKLISGRRAPIAQKIYAEIGGGSPIVKNTQAQARALEAALNSHVEENPSPANSKDLAEAKSKNSLPLPQGERNFKCFIAMRYWYPFAEGAVAAVKDFAPDKIILLPLYPQFSTTTTASSFKAWHHAAKKLRLNVPTTALCCYPDESGFINALTNATRDAYAEAQKIGTPRVLFSAHGLPEKIIRAGDPYAMQCERTVAATVRALNIPNLDYILCYQSRVGPLKWIGPATEDEIRRAGADRVPTVVVPIAFVSDHSETLVELDIEYRHLAEESGVPLYIRAPVAGVNDAFIGGLADLVRVAMKSDKTVLSFVGERICAKEFCGCACKN
jgi:protoporphyrin/coproporphyrin ferrochelatase